jgi:hypothetical protein
VIVVKSGAAQIHATQQGIGALLLGYYSWITRGDGGGELLFNELWPLMLAVGGVVALTQVRWRTETSWGIAPTFIVAASAGRALDIAFFSPAQFTGRPQLAIAIWTVIAIGTLTSWALVGALIGVFEKNPE